MELINPRKLKDECEKFKDIIFDFSGYDFGRHTIFKDDEKEFVVKVWKEDLDFHSHPKGGCIFKVLKNSLIEIRKNEEKNYIEIFKRNEGECAYIDDNIGIHSIKPEKGCVTLHYYSFVN